MSDSEEDAFQSADEGEESKSVESSPSGSSATEQKKAAQPQSGSKGGKKDRKRGKRGKKGNKSPRSGDDSEAAPQDEKKESVATAAVKLEDSPVKNDAISKSDVSPEEQAKESAEENASSVQVALTEDEKKVDTPVDSPEEVEIPEAARESAPATAPEAAPEDEPKTAPEPAPEVAPDVAPAAAPEAGRALDRLTDSQPSGGGGGGGWGWGGGWGSSLLSTATSSVSSFTNSIGEGIKTAVETVESGLGVPDPEELARIQHERRQAKAAEQQTRNEVPSQDINHDGDREDSKKADTKEDDASAEDGESSETSEKPADEAGGDTAAGGGWLSGWGVAQLSTVVHKTAEVVGKVQDSSTALVTGSLDVLETLGKKTYEAVAEGEHGVKQFKAAGAKSNLSSLLREAADEAKEKAKQEEQFVEARKSHFGAQFDDNQGLVQLEALEMLSNQCEAQVHNLLSSLSADTLPQAKSLLIAIREAFNIEEDQDDEEEEDQDFVGLMTESTGELGLKITADKLIVAQKGAIDWIKEECNKDGENVGAAAIHQEAIQSLARLTAAAVGHFHKVGQLCLADTTSSASAYRGRASALSATTKYMGTEVGLLSAKFTECLSSSAADKEDTETVNPLMTNVYLEATNSSSYIQDAFQLLLPVLQQAALQAHKQEQ